MRLFRNALLLGLSAGLGLALPNTAQAGTQMFSPPSTGVDTIGSVTFDPLSGPSIGSGMLSFENPAYNLYSVKTTFVPTLAAGSSGTFEYTLTNTIPWLSAGLTSNILSGTGMGASFTKEVCSDAAYTNCLTLTTMDTGMDPMGGGLTALPFSTNVLYVRDTFTSVGPNISDITNSFRATPGPLPILGAGAAFGFSRKLRKRIKASA